MLPLMGSFFLGLLSQNKDLILATLSVCQCVCPLSAELKFRYNGEGEGERERVLLIARIIVILKSKKPGKIGKRNKLFTRST